MGLLANMAPLLTPPRGCAFADVSVGAWMLMLDMKEYDDRRLCTRTCGNATIAAYPIDLCPGLCNPVVDMLRYFNDPNCHTRTIPRPHRQLPMYPSSIELDEDW